MLEQAKDKCSVRVSPCRDAQVQGCANLHSHYSILLGCLCFGGLLDVLPVSRTLMDVHWVLRGRVGWYLPQCDVSGLVGFATWPLDVMYVYLAV
jgi:hypothetical protein